MVDFIIGNKKAPLWGLVLTLKYSIEKNNT